MTIYKFLPLALGAALGTLIETGVRPSSACACSCDDWVKYTAQEVQGPTAAQDQWLDSDPPIYLRVAGNLVATDAEDSEGPYRVYPHSTTNRSGAE